MMRSAAQALPFEGFGYSERDDRVFRTILAGRPGICRHRHVMTFIAHRHRLCREAAAPGRLRAMSTRTRGRARTPRFTT
jgi:hypothetical protein